jgi:polyisoprenoid-binding protein YceI
MGTVWPVSDTEWTLNASDGELLVRTGVTGRAAKMGHRLTLLMNSWEATVRWADGQPVAAHLTVDVDGLAVSHGEGGLMALSAPEKSLARSHALKSLDAARFPRISFEADDIAQTDDGYRLGGTLEIRGTSRTCVVELRVEDLEGAWRMSGEADVRQTEFGVKPYSMLMGAMKVADVVTVAFTAVRNDGPGR